MLNRSLSFVHLLSFKKRLLKLGTKETNSSLLNISGLRLGLSDYILDSRIMKETNAPIMILGSDLGMLLLHQAVRMSFSLSMFQDQCRFINFQLLKKLLKELLTL